MALTSPWNIPYSALGDPPNGPSQEFGIADATNTALNTVSAAAAAAQATATAAAVVVGGKRYVTGSVLATTSSGTEILTGTDTGSVAYVAGQEYEVEWGFAHQLSIGTDVFTIRIRTTNVAGAIQLEDNLQNEDINQPLWKVFKFIYKPSSTAAATFVGTMSRRSGIGGLDSKASATGAHYFKVTKLGASGVIADI